MLTPTKPTAAKKIHLHTIRHNCKALGGNVTRVCAAQLRRAHTQAVKICNDALWKANRPITLLNQWALDRYQTIKQSTKEEREEKQTELDIARMDSEGPAMQVVEAMSIEIEESNVREFTRKVANY